MTGKKEKRRLLRQLVGIDATVTEFKTLNCEGDPVLDENEVSRSSVT